MAIDVTRDTILRFTDAAERAGVHITTLHRWRLRGVKGVRLETAKLGGFRVTTPDALSRFFVEVTAAADRCSNCATSVRPELRIELAERLLDSAGVK